jgi:hypothetical protein
MARESTNSAARTLCLCASVPLCLLLLPTLALAAEPAAKKLAPPAALAEPARLGAPELQAETCFQVLDWNGDGARDILQRSRGGDRGWLFINKGTDKEPWFEFPERLPCNFSELEKKYIHQLSDYWACDFDGDGDLDMVFTVADSGPGGLMVALNLGERKFTWLEDGVTLPNTKGAGTICAADVDGDGKPDIYQQRDKGGLGLHRNLTEKGKFAVGPAEPVLDTAGKPVEAPNPYPADFDGDGTLDLASVTPAGAFIHIGVPGSKGLTFKPAVAAVDETGKPIPGGQDVNVLDWDLDGILDLLVLDESCAVRCHRGLKKGQPAFEAKSSLIHGTALARADEAPVPSLHDWDRDGRADVLLGAGCDTSCGHVMPWARAYRNTLGSRSALGDGGFVCDGGGKPININHSDGRGSTVTACDFDGDGQMDILWATSVGEKQLEVRLLRGDADSPRKFKAAAEKLLSVEAGNSTYPGARAWATDWDGDGKTDLVLTWWAYQWQRYGLCLNQGTNQAPKFGAPRELEVGGKPLTGAYTTICTADWDGDGRPDLLALSNQPYSRPCLLWLRNADGSEKLAMPPGAPVTFDKFGFITGVEIPVGPEGRPIPMGGNIAAGDFDGDGVTDLVVGQGYGYGFYCLSDARLWLLRGVAKAAPPAVRDLTAKDATEAGVTLAWTAPAGAARAEVRYSLRPIDEATWFRAAPAKEKPEGGAVTVAGLERGRVYYFAVCTYGAGGERSAASNCLLAPTRPLKTAVLAQGLPAPALSLASYSGCIDVIVRGGTPPPAAVDGKGLRNQWVPPEHSQSDTVDSYLKFDLAPLKGKTVRRAVLTLTRTEGALLGDKRVLCREVLADWEPAKVRFETRDGAAKWTKADRGEALVDVDSEPILGRKRWDATDALTRLLKSDRPVLSLQMSRGPYGSSNSYHDSESKDAGSRPSLTVVFEDGDK